MSTQHAQSYFKRNRIGKCRHLLLHLPLGKGKGATYPKLFSVGITTWMSSGKVDDRLALGAGRLQPYPKIDSLQGQVMASSPPREPAGKQPRLSTGMASWSSKGMQSSRGSTATPHRFLACPHMNRRRSTDWKLRSALHRGDPFDSSTSSPNRETFWIYGLGESLRLLENMQHRCQQWEILGVSFSTMGLLIPTPLLH